MNDEQKQLVKNIDAFVSATTGAGVSGQDKFVSYNFQQGIDLDHATLEALYTDNDLAATIVERIVHDALRSGYELDWQGATDQQRRDVRDWAESRYKVTEETRQARIFARLFGGGAVFMGIEGDAETRTIPGQEVKFLRAVPSSELYGWSWYANPLDQNFGEVAVYKYHQPTFSPVAEAINRNPLDFGRGSQGLSPIEMHESRFIPYYGTLTTDRQRWENRGWGKSVLHRVYDVLLKFEASFDSVLQTLSEQSFPLYKVKSLLDLLASENGELLAKRFELINAAKGAYRAVILDQEEDLTRVEANLSSASDVVKAAMQRLAGASGQPSTILWGVAPSGQNATGKSDLENWNQQVASEQSLILGPGIKSTYKFLLAQEESPVKGVQLEDLRIIFPAVETPSLQDKVNLYAQTAGADAVYEKMGAATASQIAMARAQDSELFPNVDLAFHRELDELRKEKLLNPPDPMAMAEEEPDTEEEESGDSKAFNVLDSEPEMKLNGTAWKNKDGHVVMRSGGEDVVISYD